MKSDGRAQRRLVALGSGPVWVPDSRRIAYGMSGDIRTIGTDRSGERQLVRSARSPAWSPDVAEELVASGLGA
jgi:Tol biopolymer transport system component